MNPDLEKESERLSRSWMRHEPAWLRDYLVAGVEDPRLNLQSILSRHFLVTALSGERFRGLMEQEYRFSAAMNWLLEVARKAGDPDEFEAILYALRRGADNAEGLEIPQWFLQMFVGLDTRADGLGVPNYIEAFLTDTPFVDGKPKPSPVVLETFQSLWHTALSVPQLSTLNPQPLTVLEPACGSANDYRFLHAYGLARWLDYTGFDLCEKNVMNARALFPGVRFEVGNVFEIGAPDRAFDLCFVHDLFEHLSLAGLERAVAEVCRVTRHGLCVGFFHMDEIPEHQVQPWEEYHWNTLSMRRTRELFARHGFAAQVVHMDSFARQQLGCSGTHNPKAYTFLLRRNEA